MHLREGSPDVEDAIFSDLLRIIAPRTPFSHPICLERAKHDDQYLPHGIVSNQLARMPVLRHLKAEFLQWSPSSMRCSRCLPALVTVIVPALENLHLCQITLS
jgi:hypothetical protein